MAEKTKSTTTTAKPRKPAAKKKVAIPSNVTEITATREQRAILREISKEEIAQLAHKLWNERGRQHGQDADDWFRAEQLLRSKAS
jgi:glutamate formiminotransferase